MSLNPLNPARARSRIALTAVTVVLAGGLIAGCGEDRSNLLPGNTVEEIETNLDRVRDLAASGDCFGAIDAAQQVKRQVEGLGPDVDRRLKRSLRDGATQLVLAVQDNCSSTEEEPVEEPVEPETTTTGPTGDTQVEEPEEEPDTGATGQDRQQGERPERGGGQGGNQGNGTGGNQTDAPPSNGSGTGGNGGGGTGGGTGGVGPGTGGVGPPTG